MCTQPFIIKSRMKDSKKSLYLENGYHVYQSQKIPCGRCVECRKSEKRQWICRLYYEYLEHQKNQCYFVTLTFSEKHLPKDTKQLTHLVRLFLERYRKKYKKSVRHFLVCERGTRTNRLHLHGIFFDCEASRTQLRKLWQYGFIWLGEKFSLKTIFYISKYISKNFGNPESKKFVSPGLGRYGLHFIKYDINGKLPKINVGKYTYILPRYYYNKIYDSYKRYALNDKYQHEQLLNFKKKFKNITYTDEIQYLLAVGRYNANMHNRLDYTRLTPYNYQKFIHLENRDYD